jgi:hypothetical protein
MRPIVVGAFDGVDTGRGREGAYPDRPLHPLSLSLPLSELTATGGDAILYREGYINMDDGEGRQNTADLNRSTLVSSYLGGYVWT